MMIVILKILSVILVSGPHDCGKTAAVYALAQELGSKVCTFVMCSQSHIILVSPVKLLLFILWPRNWDSRLFGHGSGAIYFH